MFSGNKTDKLKLLLLNNILIVFIFFKFSLKLQLLTSKPYISNCIYEAERDMACCVYIYMKSYSTKWWWGKLACSSGTMPVLKQWSRRLRDDRKTHVVLFAFSDLYIYIYRSAQQYMGFLSSSGEMCRVSCVECSPRFFNDSTVLKWHDNATIYRDDDDDKPMCAWSTSSRFAPSLLEVCFWRRSWMNLSWYDDEAFCDADGICIRSNRGDDVYI